MDFCFQSMEDIGDDHRQRVYNGDTAGATGRL
jgi:hypothetical protein